MSNSSIFTVRDRMGNMPDVQKGYMFELVIPATGIGGDTVRDEDLIIRAKTATIPGRDHELIESVFMGTKQYFVAKPTYSSTLEVTFDEHEDQMMLKFFKAWQDQMFDQKTGKMQVATKAEYVKDIILNMYKGNGEKLQTSIKFKNAWPKTTADSSLDMAAGEKVTRPVTFQYDYWEFEQ